jgi:threonine/homoserine/homoserine lactone efflux protein
MRYFLNGLAIGFLIAAPVGPIGILCIRRTLGEGRWRGFLTGLGAATADAFYGTVAAFGLTSLASFLTGQKIWIGVLGGIFLCYLGVKTFFSPPAEKEAGTREAHTDFSAYLSTLFLTLTNPATILSFVAVFARFGLGVTPNYLDAGLMVFGVFFGSALWWFFLSGTVSLFRYRVTPGWMQIVNRAAGLLIFTFGICAILFR